MSDGLGARGLLSLYLHGPKIVDVVEAMATLDLLGPLDAGPIALGELAARAGAIPLRLYKLLDCLESAGLVRRTPGRALIDTTYVSVSPLAEAARLVLGPASIERDRDGYAWRSIHGRLVEVVRGRHAIAEADFAWPPRGEAQIAAFEASMAAGTPPIVESLLGAGSDALPKDARVLDVGGGDGTVAARLLDARPDLRVSVLNLPAVGPLVERTLAAHRGRARFVGADFLAEPLPGGHDVIAFVRVLHDWPDETARALLAKAFDALGPGGRVVVCEELRDAERLAIQFFWTYFLVGVDGCTSRLRESSVYAEMLGALGFVGTRVVAGPFDLVVAERPR